MKILIVDDEQDICEIIEFLIQDNFSCETKTVLVASGNAAIKILREQNDFDYCICDHNMPDGMGTEVLKYIIEVKSKVKFVLCSTVTPSDRPSEYPSEYVFFNIQKPDIGMGVERLYHFAEEILPEKILINPEDYYPVPLRVLHLMDKLPADIYIRMSDNKFIKCIKQSENFSVVDQEKYQKKSINELYIKKGQHDPSINEIILETVQKIMNRRNLPLEERMSITHSQLVALIKFKGITPELAEASKNNIQQAISFIMKSPFVANFWKEMNLLGEYPSNLYTLHSILASVVAKKLHWYSEATMYKLTLSAFLQDISLTSIPLMEICDYQEFTEKKSRFTSEEIKGYCEHPLKATEILSHFKEIPPDVDRILLEQHEMPNGNGFPRKLNATQLGALSCVFVLTGIFARHIMRDKHSFDLGLFCAEMESRGYSRGNFKEAFEVIKSMKKLS